MRFPQEAKGRPLAQTPFIPNARCPQAPFFAAVDLGRYLVPLNASPFTYSV